MLGAGKDLFHWKPKYFHPSDDDDGLDHESLLPDLPIPLKPPRQPHSGLSVALITLLLCSVVYISTGFWAVQSSLKAKTVADADEWCMHRISGYCELCFAKQETAVLPSAAPVMKDVQPGWHTQRFNGTRLHENVYRQDAGPKVDAAWKALGVDYGPVAIPEREALQSGLRYGFVKISPEYGGGYPANVEALHHLHCLNVLRKTMHWNYDYYVAQGFGTFENSKRIVHLHATHCLDILRQKLMCNPDVGVLGQMWRQSDDGLTIAVDFFTEHKCRDFEGVRRWAEAHQLPVDNGVGRDRFLVQPEPEDVLPDLP